MGQRAWFALHCLPRDPKGAPPSIRELERRHEISNMGLNRLIWDELKRPGLEVLSKAAAALNTTPEWLQFGRGDGPKASWPVPNRPAERPKRTAESIGTGAQAAFDREAKKLSKG